MAEELISQYVDRAAFASDTDFIEAQLKRVFALQDQLFKTRDDVKAASTFKEISTAAESGAKAIDLVGKSVERLKFAVSDENIELQKNNALIQAANKEAKALGKEQAGLATEYDKQSKRLEAVKNQLKGLVAEGKDSGETFEKLRLEFTQLDTVLRKADKSVGDFRRNVGNYEGSAKIIVDALEKEKQKLEELEKARIRVQNAGATFNPGSVAARTTITGFAGGQGNNVAAINNIAKTATTADEAVAKLNEEIEKSRTIVEGFSRVTENDKFLNIAGRVGDANTEIRFFTKSLIELERQGLGDTEAAKALRKQLAELTAQINDTRQEVKALSSATRGFDLFAGSVSLVADTFQTAAGAAVLFGASEKDAAEATKTLVAIQSVSNGVKSIANELTTKGTAANKLLTGAQKLYTFAVGESTGATKLFRQALLALGITAVIFGLYEAAKAMGAFGDAAEEAKEKQQALNDETEKYLSTVKKADELSKATRDRVKNGLFEQERELKILKDKKAPLSEIYNAELKLSQLKEQQANTSFFAAQQDIKDAQLRGASQEILNDLTIKAIEKEKAYKDAIAETASVTIKYGQDVSAKVKDARDKSLKEREAILKEELDLEKRNAAAEKQIAIEAANEKIRIAEQTAGNDNASIQSQLNALNVIANRKKTLAFIEFQDAIKSEQQIRGVEIIEVKKTQKEIEAATVSFNNKIRSINDDDDKQRTEALKRNAEKIQEEKLKSLDRYTQAVRDEEKKDLNESIVNLNDRFRKGLISQEQYNKEREKLNIDYNLKSLQTEIDYQKKLIAIGNLSPEAKAEALRKLNDLEADLNELSLKRVKDAEAEKLAAIKKTLDEISASATTAFEFIGGLLNANSEIQKNKIKEEQDAAEAKAARDIEIIEASSLKEEEKAAKKELVNKRLAIQKEQFEKREREINLQNARFEKSKNIFSITLSTAKAVAEASPDPFRIALAIALGAAQLGIAVATPLPKYYKGKNVTAGADKYEGWATVNEYRDEVIRRTDGKVEFPKGRNVVTWLGSDDQVFPSLDAYLDDVIKSTHKGAMQRPQVAKVIVDNSEAKKTNALLQKLINKPSANVNIYDNGHAYYEIEQTNW